MRRRVFLRSSCVLPLVLCVIAPLAIAAETSRAEYAASVEPICKANTQANERILAGVKAEVRQGRLKPAAAKFAKATSALKKTLVQLRGVQPPVADKARIETWLADIKVESELFSTVARKLGSGNKNGAEHLVAKLSANANKTNDVVLPFEFRYCRLEPSRFT